MEKYEKSDVELLIVKCRSDDSAAFCELLTRYTPMIKKVISGFGDNLPFEYDELFSEAYVGLHSAVESFDLKQSEVTFGLYARACVYHRLVDLIRASERKLNIVDVDVERVSAGNDPESVIVGRERFDFLLKSAADLLSEYEYRVLVLHIQGYKTAKIAEILSKSSKSVDNAKARLFKRLRESLGESDKQ